MLLEYMKRYEKRTIVSSILMAVIAILLIIEPETMLNTVMLILGIGILIDGLISVIVYIFTNKEQRAFSNSLVEGTLALVIAVLILTNKKIMISIIPIIIGSWIIIKSIVKLQLALSIRSINEKSWILLMISAIITLVLGIIILVNPFSTMVTITVLGGILLLATAVIDIIDSICILSKLK